MNLSIMNNLEIDKKTNIEKIKKLLLKNGVDGYMETPVTQSIVAEISHHTTSSLEKQLRIIEKETKIIVPNVPFFSLFYDLDNGDFKVAYLYGPNFNNYLTMKNPQLDNIINIGKGLTQLTSIPLINIYEGERWSLPRIQIYKAGKIIKESDSVGKEIYSPDFERKDELEYIENAEEINWFT